MDARSAARSIFEAALRAADPAEAIARHLKREGNTLIAGDAVYDLTRFRSVTVVGAGKAGAPMAQAVENLLSDKIRSGLVVVKDGHTAPLRRVVLRESSHPLPDARGVEAAREIASLADGLSETDLLICVISGGASALLPLPVDSITLDDKIATTRLLLDCGATIHEINTVRKHLSKIKGGWLAVRAFPATVLSLILSDVIGDDLDVIGSGLTAPDRFTFADAQEVLDKYALRDRIPAAVREHIEYSGEETPKQNHPAFQRTQNLVVGGNRLALNAAALHAERLGYRPMVLSTLIEGETREIARMHCAIAREIVASGKPMQAPCALLSGGETTVTIRGKGKGGRNQEFVLAAAMEIAGHGPITVLSGGTDGTDGPTGAAGAIADQSTISRSEALGLSAKASLRENDSYTFFTSLNDLLITGPTGTNVMDVRVILISQPG